MLICRLSFSASFSACFPSLFICNHERDSTRHFAHSALLPVHILLVPFAPTVSRFSRCSMDGLVESAWVFFLLNLSFGSFFHLYLIQQTFLCSSLCDRDSLRSIAKCDKGGKKKTGRRFIVHYISWMSVKFLALSHKYVVPDSAGRGECRCVTAECVRISPPPPLSGWAAKEEESKTPNQLITTLGHFRLHQRRRSPETRSSLCLPLRKVRHEEDMHMSGHTH